MSGIYAWINLAEAALWTGMAVIAVGLALRPGPRVGSFVASRAGTHVLATTLLAFGASDIVETYTGAWWRPWWLVLWKGSCVLVLFAYVATWLGSPRAG